MRIVNRLRYVHEYHDRHGKLRRYFRAPGRPRIALPGELGSTEFIEAYRAALAGLTIKPEIGKSRSVLGTVSAAIAAYYTDERSGFLALAPITQKNRRALLERFRRDHGHRVFAQMDRIAVLAVLKPLSPFAQHGYLKALRHLMRYAVEAELRDDDPSEGITQAKTARPEDPDEETGYHTWTDDEIAKFEARHPIGSNARLAMALLLYTGQRRADAVRMGRQHLKDGFIEIRQSKTRKTMRIPVHPELARILAASKLVGSSTFLVTHFGKPYSAPGFGNAFRGWCDEADLPECSAHGLRKAIARSLAEVGCTAPQIAAITGHSLKEVQRYIEGADQKRLAAEAMRRLIEYTKNRSA